MTTRTTARPTTGAGPTPEDHNTVNDADLHHLFDLIRDDRIRFASWRHTDTAGNDIDRLVYGAEDAGLVTVHPGGVIKPTHMGRTWRDSHHRPGPPSIVFRAKGA